MTQIFRKEGWMLNPNDKVVNAILKGVERSVTTANVPVTTTDTTSIVLVAIIARRTFVTAIYI